MRSAFRAERGAGLLAGLVLVLGLGLASGTDAGAEPGGFIGNRNSKVFHREECASAVRTAEQNRVTIDDPDAALADGFRPCGLCKPDALADGRIVRASLGPQDPPRNTARRKPGAAKTKPGAESPPDDPETPRDEPKTDAPGESTRDDGRLKFSRDIAPIFVGNCMGCHNAQRKQGEFNLSTFQGLRAGSQSGEVVVAGKPEESLLVELVATRQMPRGGGNRRLSDEAIEKIRRWVAEGAALDPGISPSAALDKVAPSADQMRRAALERLSPEDRDAQLEALARDRWKQAGAAGEPTLTSGKSFALFGSLPESRARAALKAAEDSRTKLGSLLGPEAAAPLAGPEKVSLYVFNDANAYAEFNRAVVRREIEPGEEVHGKLDGEGPFVAVIDPLAGGDELPPARRPASKKKAEDVPDGPERSLPGLVSEGLGVAAARAGGSPPRWLAEGLGAYLASAVEPRSPYYNGLRFEAYSQAQLGWAAKAGEALGDQGSADTLRALGFSLFEWMSSAYRAQMPYFVRGLLEGGEKLDEVNRGCFGPRITRDQFLSSWGQWVTGRYGPLFRRR